MILVTGGTGLTGQFVVADLLRRGQAVRILCRPDSLAEGARPPGADIALGDLRDPDSLLVAARGTSGIIHTACTYTDSAIDVAAMAALLAGWQAGPFIFLSSLDVYGMVGSGATEVTEDTRLCDGDGDGDGEVSNDYSRGKVACERLLAAAAARRGRRDHVMLRAPYIWGPHATARKRLVTRRLDQHQPIVLPGVDPAQWSQYRDAWIDVRDLTTLITACLEHPVGGPLNVLTGHFAWHDLYVELIRLTGSRSQLVHKPLAAITDEELPRKQLYAQPFRFSEARLARVLGTLPRLTFEVTVRDTVRFSPVAQKALRTTT